MSGRTPVSSDRGASEDRESESSAGDATAALGPVPLPPAPSAASGATTDRMTAIDVEKPDADGDDGTTRVTATFRPDGRVLMIARRAVRGVGKLAVEGSVA